MQLDIYQVDAFTSHVFAGNPAAVCLLDDWLAEDVMQSIAAENNLSETAFVTRGPGTLGSGAFGLRWFTPAVEVELCGHATLASAFVLRNFVLEEGATEVRFHTRHSGELRARFEAQRIVLDFPSRPGAPADAPGLLLEGLGASPIEVLEAPYWMAVYESEEQVRDLRPDFRRLARLDKGVIATAPGDDVDFVSRFFGPSVGIDEDPVTGSAHCTLTPYWAAKLGRSALSARQISARGGDLACTDRGERVDIAGNATLYLRGTIEV